jgi:hypothetical protein
LNIACRAVNVPIESELQFDPSLTKCALGGHLGDIGNDAEVALKRGRHCSRHRLGARPGHRSKYRYGWVINLWQGRHGQLQVGEEAGKREAKGKQGCRDRPLDQDRREVHRPSPVVLAMSSACSVAPRFAESVEAATDQQCYRQRH